MIIRQENEPNNGSVWRWAIMVFRKPFNVCFALAYSFSYSGYSFSEQETLVSLWFIEAGRGGRVYQRKSENHAKLKLKFNGTLRKERPKHFRHLTKLIFLLEIKTLMALCEL